MAAGELEARRQSRRNDGVERGGRSWEKLKEASRHREGVRRKRKPRGKVGSKVE